MLCLLWNPMICALVFLFLFCFSTSSSCISYTPASPAANRNDRFPDWLTSRSQSARASSSAQRRKIKFFLPTRLRMHIPTACFHRAHEDAQRGDKAFYLVGGEDFWNVIWSEPRMHNAEQEILLWCCVIRSFLVLVHANHNLAWKLVPMQQISSAEHILTSDSTRASPAHLRAHKFSFFFFFFLFFLVVI